MHSSLRNFRLRRVTQNEMFFATRKRLRSAPAENRARESGLRTPVPPTFSSSTSEDRSQLRCSRLPKPLKKRAPRYAKHVWLCMLPSMREELAASITASETRKVASLERELVAVDAALERFRTDSGVVQEAVSTLSEADLEAQHAALSSRLDGMEAQLQTLPAAVVEPPFVGLIADATSLLSSIVNFGRVIAPLPVSLGVRLEPAPSSVRLGASLRLRLSVGDLHAAESAEELEVSLGKLAAATCIEASVE